MKAENINFSNAVWERIKENQNNELSLKKGKKVSYEIMNETIFWKTIEPSQNILFPQSKKQILECIPAKEKGLNPSEYPGTARSYKWALLNHDLIWEK